MSKSAFTPNHDPAVENLRNESNNGAALALVTVNQPFDLAGAGLFAVQGGIPLGDAMDAMAVLLNTAHSTACDAAMAADNENKGAVWAVEHLLLLARALNASIHGGLVAGGGVNG